MAEAAFECDAEADYIPVGKPKEVVTVTSSSAPGNGTNATSTSTSTAQYATQFTECLPRPKRCVCLGDIDNADHAELLLDMYCRWGRSAGYFVRFKHVILGGSQRQTLQSFGRYRCATHGIG